MKIDIVCVGKIKEKYFTEALSEYAKRLSKYCTFSIKEVADEKTPENASSKEETQIKAKEADRLYKYISDDAYVIALAIEGKKYDSVGFSQKIDKIWGMGKSHIIFVIGGSLGIHEDLKKRADELISFSDMTFPHQLMRVILAEQIYRAFRISNNEPYHK